MQVSSVGEDVKKSRVDVRGVALAIAVARTGPIRAMAVMETLVETTSTSAWLVLQVTFV